MSYVLGVDLGTSAVKVLLVNIDGKVVFESSSSYALSQTIPGYSEQNPEDWVNATTNSIREILEKSGVNSDEIKGMSFSGQMHGLVLLNKNDKVLRPAILWNDTRTTAQVREIEERMGERFVDITRNRPLAGFTLPKLLWVKENEPEIFQQATSFVLPKDYLRFRMTGKLEMELSDASGTVMVNTSESSWSKEICDIFGIPEELCPPIIGSLDNVGSLTAEYAKVSGLTPNTKVFGGGADNACGAIGAGIVEADQAMCSIGTSGVILSFEPNIKSDYRGDLHFFNHVIPESYYSMGVTLAAGYSLSWLKKNFGENVSFNDFVEGASQSRIGSHGLLFTPYIVGERTPYPDSDIRGSFVGIDSKQNKNDFTRAVLEGITFSFKDILNIYKRNGKVFKRLTAIGGGAKSPLWMQIQADVFDAEIVRLESEQGPGLGAAMLAAVGLGWFEDISTCVRAFTSIKTSYYPIAENVSKYEELHEIYTEIYPKTKEISKELIKFQ